MPYDFTCMQNPKKKNKKRVINTENKWAVDRGEGGCRVKQVKETERYKPSVKTNKPL